MTSHPEWPGRLSALFVFFLGVGLLAVVFVFAWHLFRSPVPGLRLPPASGDPNASNSVITALTTFGMRLLLLGVMTFVASKVAGTGIDLYFSASHPAAKTASTPAPTAPMPDSPKGDTKPS